MGEINNIGGKPSVVQMVTDRLVELDLDCRRGEVLMTMAQLLPQLLVSDDKIAEVVKEPDRDIIESARHELCAIVDHVVRFDDASVVQNQIECQREERWSLVDILRRAKEVEQ